MSVNIIGRVQVFTVKPGYSALVFSGNLYVVNKFKGYEKYHHLFYHFIQWNLYIVDKFDIQEGFYYIKLSLFLQGESVNAFTYIRNMLYKYIHY